jgi:hypothetical protein
MRWSSRTSIISRHSASISAVRRSRASAPVRPLARAAWQCAISLDPAHARECVDEALAMRLDLGLLHLLVEAVDHRAQLQLALAQQVPEREQAAHAERCSDAGVEHALLTAFDALREHHLALAREQRDLPHLAQVDAHRVVGARIFLVVYGARLANTLDAIRAVHDRDLGLAEDGHHLVELLGREHIGQRVVQLGVGQVALAAALADQILHVAELARLGAHPLAGAGAIATRGSHGRSRDTALRGGRETPFATALGVGSASGRARSHGGSPLVLVLRGTCGGCGAQPAFELPVRRRRSSWRCFSARSL